MDLSERTRLTSRIIAKDEADRAAARMLQRFALPDSLTSRLQVETELHKILGERIRRGRTDPAARVGAW